MDGKQTNDGDHREIKMGNFNDKDITYGYKAFTCDKVPINWSFNAVFTSEKIVA